jgi:hydroxylamine reductase
LYFLQAVDNIVIFSRFLIRIKDFVTVKHIMVPVIENKSRGGIPRKEQEMSMFCYQCEQTAKGSGCTVRGVCGKQQDTATLQDLLVYTAKGIGMWAHRAARYALQDRGTDRFVLKALFTTVTNVNFDAERVAALVREGCEVRDHVRARYEQACRTAGDTPEVPGGPAVYTPAATQEELVRQGETITITRRMDALGPDVTGLQELLTYGLKGMAAYADHAMILGKEDEKVYAFFHEALDFLAAENADPDALVHMVLRCGEMNLRVMEMLDAAHTETFGHPEPTQVRITPVKGHAILVSGHDLRDLELLLQQTEGQGINIYTHGEMLPCNAYPQLKKYPHLVGNYGGAWQDQRREFEAFPGAILMTTNCIQQPKDSYQDRIFTTGLVAWPHVRHIADKDFSPVIDAALGQPGFTGDDEEQYITIGFGHNAVMGVADKVIQAVKDKAIRHFFLVGGCDGAKPGRNYYTEFAQAVPDDCVILTLACGKYRFNKLAFGDIGGIPRLLDCGQCNDAFSAVKIASALSEAFGCGINDLPLSLILSWYEQKAVCILLSLLHLGVRNMRLGPTLPAFVTPAILDVLVNKFNIMPVTTAEEDLAACLAGGA